MLPRSPFVALALVLLVSALPSTAHAAAVEDLEQKLKSLQEQVDDLKQQIERQKQTAPPPPPPPPTAATEPPMAPSRPLSISDFKIGGYGSVRFEASDLHDLKSTFTFRRFVLSGDATIANRLRGVVEVEFERFTELEVERGAPLEGGLRGFSQSIESSDKTELSLEQAWVQFALTDWAKFRAGVVLVPLGRFNINHDDNRWDLPRRSLVDRGVPVLPVTAAWSEVGMGFNGDIPIGRYGKLTYEAYVMNGATLDSSIETVARGSGELEAEVEIQPRRGTANIDLKNEKAGAFRLAWSPAIGHEIGASAYYGRYTPDFLPSASVWSVSVDGKTTLGPFEIEGEYVLTRYDDILRVARGFARAVSERAFEAEVPPLTTTVEFELAGLAETKHGYWLDVRYRFFPDFLRESVLGRLFANPQFIVTARWEQVWLDGLVREVDFMGSQLTSLTKEHRFVDRATLGFAYRPVPLVVFQTAYERTWTDRGKSLAGVTNFLPARAGEDTANAFLFGVAFGF
ncbi:MAG TPA: hypothetical protein VGL09_03935 [Methylomirabilota bacterium]